MRCADCVEPVRLPPNRGEVVMAKVLIEVISGCEGPCLSIALFRGEDTDGGTRIAGPKPWGGGRTTHKFLVDADELRRELDALTNRPTGEKS